MRRLFRENGLTMALFALFAFSLVGQSVAGHLSSNEERIRHGSPPQPYSTYIVSSHAMEAVTENWESEFLQLFAYVSLTAFLRQRGSAESKPFEGSDRDELEGGTENAPWPVRRGGWVRSVYSHSLSLAFLVLFLISFSLHLASGAAEYNDDLVNHGSPAISTLAYLGKPRFWFESFQNWQSEFFSLGLVVVFSIFLREKGSPQSKPVGSPHGQTGA